MTSVPTHNNPNNTLLIADVTLKYVTRDTCRKSKKIVPNLYPYINGLSQYSSLMGSFIQIYVYGENFFPYGQTTVNFGNIQNIPINFLSSNAFYFELQNFAFPGVYKIIVNNNLNLNAKNVTANTITGLSLQSNIVEYRIE
jgi:hypothetical protein